MKDKSTPEEKLLKILEDPTVAKRSPSAVTKGKVSLFAGLSGSLEGLKNAFKSLKLETVNRILLGLCVAFTILAVFDFMKISSDLEDRFAQIQENSAIAAVDQTKKISLETNINEIQAQARKRNIFTFIPAAPEKKISLDTSETIKSLKLVGVIWSDNPQAMIEYTKSGKTHLLGAGETIEGFKVKKVLRNQVLIEREGMEWTIE
ncbi:MAG: hypothetical protein JW734_04460 [Candidatus Omnitrophica bacterium]|nr:hypothetical protein [Candidatus Omnitrophota bacterium]